MDDMKDGRQSLQDSCMYTVHKWADRNNIQVHPVGRLWQLNQLFVNNWGSVGNEARRGDDA